MPDETRGTTSASGILLAWRQARLDDQLRLIETQIQRLESFASAASKTAPAPDAIRTSPGMRTSSDPQPRRTIPIAEGPVIDLVPQERAAPAGSIAATASVLARRSARVLDRIADFSPAELLVLGFVAEGAGDYVAERGPARVLSRHGLIEADHGEWRLSEKGLRLLHRRTL